MSGFMYFVEGAQAPEPARRVILDAGADYALPFGINCIKSGHGPGGPGGMLFSPTMTTVNTDAQIWERSACGTYWVGMDANKLPTPEDLAVENQISGHYVEMADGNKWLIPAARYYGTAEGTGEVGWVPNLPTARKFTGGKWIEGSILAKHRKLWEHMQRIDSIFEKVLAGEESALSSLDLETESDLVVTALATNYRVGNVEASMLGIVTSDIAGEIANAVRDVPSLVVLQEKKAEAPGGDTG